MYNKIANYFKGEKMKKFKIFTMLSVFAIALLGCLIALPKIEKVEAAAACFSDTNGTYSSLSEAVSSSTTERTITMIADSVITEDITIPSYVTLLIPFSSTDTTGTEIGTAETADPIASWNYDAKLFRTLTISSNATLTIEGSVILGGIQFFPKQYAQGITSGAYSKIVNNGTINVYGSLKIHGLVIGSGNIEVFDGSKLYEPFIINDFSGGTNTKAVYDAGRFPLDLYATINIQQELKINYGSSVIGMGGVYTNEKIYTQNFDLIGKDRGLVFLNKEGSYIISTYDPDKYISTLGTYTNDHDKIVLKDTGKRTLNVYGGATAGNISLTYQVSILTYTATTKGKFCAIPYNFDVVLNSGDYILPSGYGYKIMPGANVTVGEDANLIVDGMLHVYDALEVPNLSNKMYPSASVLKAAGFSTIGNLFVKGKMTVNGTFAGIVQAGSIGAEVVTASSASLGDNAVKHGYCSKYGTNYNEFALPANIMTLNDGLISMQVGKNYVSTLLTSWTVGSKTIKYMVASSKSDYDLYCTNLFTKYYFKYATKTVNPNAQAKGMWCEKHEHNYELNVDYTNKKAVYTCLNDNNCPAITKQAFEKPTISGEYTFNASEQQVVLNNFNSSYMVAYNTSATFAGTYTVRVSLKYPDSTCWLDDTASTGNISLTWTIKKQVVEKFTIASVNQYAKTAFATCDNSCVTLVHKTSDGRVLYSAPTDVGSYIAEYSLKSISSSEWSDGTTDKLIINYEITPKNLVVIVYTATSQYKQDLSSLSYNTDIVGLCEGDDLNIYLSTNANKMVVGRYDIDATYTNLNYNITFIGLKNGYHVMKATSVITTSDLTVTYDGAYHRISAFLNNDEQTLVYSSNNNQKDYIDGGYTVTITAAETTNYKAASATAKLTINKKQINVTINALTAVYGEGEKELTFTCSTLAQGDSVEDLNIVLTRQSGDDVGAYLISGLYSNSNYQVKFSENVYYTITPAAFSGIEFNSDVVTYDGNSHTISVSGLAQGASVVYTPQVKDFTDAGTYEITAVISMENYSDLTLTASLVINKKEVDVKVNDLTSKYKEALKTESEYSFTILTQDALAEGDDEFDLAITFNMLEAVDNMVLVCGRYEITATSASKNYDVNITSGYYTIEKIEGVISAQDVVVVYDGEYHGINATVNNDEQQISYSNVNSFKNVVSEQEVVVSVNETLNYKASSVTKKVTITKKPVQITVNNMTSEYAEPLHTLGDYGFTITNGELASGDTLDALAVSINALAELASGFRKTGNYTITASSESVNYDVEIVYGVYTITKITSEIVAEDLIVTYDGKYHSIVATIGNSEQTLVYSQNNNQKDFAEEGYYITISAEETENYNAVSKTVRLVIGKKYVEVVVDSKVVEYGAPEEELTYDVNESQLAQGESEDVLGITLTRFEGKTPNNYAITGTSTNTNYKVAFLGEDKKENTAVYEIVKATSKITIIKNEFTYDGLAHCVVATVNNDSQTVLYINNDEQIEAGSKVVTAYVEENEFYLASSEETMLIINKKSYDFTFEDEHAVYDGRPHDPLIPVEFAPELDYNYVISMGEETFDRIVNAGTYIVTVTISDGNYEGEFVYKYVMDKAARAINVFKTDLTINATNVSSEVKGDYLYSLDNENFFSSLDFKNLNPLTTYSLYIKQVEDENHYEAKKTIEFTTTRSVSDVKQKIDALSSEITTEDFIKLSEIKALLEQVSEQDKLAIVEEVQVFNAKVSAYNSFVQGLNSTASQAKRVANNMFDFVMSTIAAASVLAAAAFVTRKFLGL